MKPTLRLCAAPRSVSDATRFTATTLHASSKTATPPPRFTPSKGGPLRPPPGGSSGGSGGPAMFETPEQKVARLRAAHDRAKAAEVSKFDKIVDASRKVFDSAHKVTVAGLIGFTVLAGLVTAYTAFDMIMYNKKRSAEWLEAQRKIEADSLEAARIAYMTGKANEEQIALVEEQLERERESGRKTSFFNNVSVLEATGAATNPSTPPSNTTETVSWSSASQSQSQQQPPHQDQQDQQPPQQQKTSLWSWLTSNLKTEEEAEPTNTPPSPISSQRRLGYESLSDDNGATGGGAVRDSDVVRAVEQRQAQLQAKASAAVERERENQRTGGPLDRVGVAGAGAGAGVGAGEEEQGAKQGGRRGRRRGGCGDCPGGEGPPVGWGLLSAVRMEGWRLFVSVLGDGGRG
ncbi:cytochrome oxidase c assembly-domain-containing protein [Chaetomium sp. MPI-CAGE-AT-0009]|nr:cytochrome oxidase c assembly-domain-containing protein [Chaetomium sp. MPI-CAGE-AT-0009]